LTPKHDEIPKDKEQWLTAAHAHEQAGHYQDALLAIDQAILLDPADAWIYRDKGNRLYDLQHYGEALTAFEQALQLNPNDTDSANKKRDILILFDRYQPLTEEQVEPGKEPCIWRIVNIPAAEDICERILGVSLPLDHQIIVISYEGIHSINLDGSWYVQQDRSYPEGSNLYDWKQQLLRYHGEHYQILGLHGGQQLFQSKYNEQITIASHKQDRAGQRSTIQTVRVRGEKGDTLLEYSFEDLSGDWVSVSFSPDSKYIIIGAPYHLRVFQRCEGG